MKKVAWKWKKMLLLTGMVSAMGLAVCACGDAKGEAGQEVPQGIEGEPISEEGDKSEDAVQESAADEGGRILAEEWQRVRKRLNHLKGRKLMHGRTVPLI